MAALHDGEQYLLEKYAIAVTPALQILEPQPQKQKPLRALIAGVSESRLGYPALPFVEVEVEKISSIIPSSVLLNQSFTTTALENALNSSYFPVVHLATNGEFSSEDTFILAWDKKLQPRNLMSYWVQENRKNLTRLNYLLSVVVKVLKGIIKHLLD